MAQMSNAEFEELKRSMLVRFSFNGLRKSEPRVLLKELNECSLSADGCLKEWCERLLRFRLRTTGRMPKVPWNPAIDVRPSGNPEVAEVPVSITREYEVFMRREVARS